MKTMILPQVFDLGIRPEKPYTKGGTTVKVNPELIYDDKAFNEILEFNKTLIEKKLGVEIFEAILARDGSDFVADKFSLVYHYPIY